MRPVLANDTIEGNLVCLFEGQGRIILITAELENPVQMQAFIDNVTEQGEGLSLARIVTFSQMPTHEDLWQAIKAGTGLELMPNALYCYIVDIPVDAWIPGVTGEG